MAQVRETAQWNGEEKAHLNVWHTRVRNWLCRPNLKQKKANS